MFDILLNKDGDIDISGSGVFSTTTSVRQAILIHLRWFFGEWRFGPELGFPWFEEVFVKNPNLTKLRHLIRDEIKKVDGIVDVNVDNIVFDKQKREATVKYKCTTTEEIFEEEAILNVRN